MAAAAGGRGRNSLLVSCDWAPEMMRERVSMDNGTKRGPQF